MDEGLAIFFDIGDTLASAAVPSFTAPAANGVASEKMR